MMHHREFFKLDHSPEQGMLGRLDRVSENRAVVQALHAAMFVSNSYSALAACVLFLHVLFILWVVFGALLTRRRPILRWLHIASLIWGICTELLLWPCPLTLLENWLESRAGVEPYQGGFLLHYLDRLVYPDIPAVALAATGVIVCTFNLILYAKQIWSARSR